MQHTSKVFLDALDETDEKHIRKLAEKHGVKFCTMLGHLIRTGIRRRRASTKYAASPRGQRARRRAELRAR